MAHSSLCEELPSESFSEFKSTRVVIDATEFPVEKPFKSRRAMRNLVQLQKQEHTESSWLVVPRTVC